MLGLSFPKEDCSVMSEITYEEDRDTKRILDGNLPENSEKL